MRQVRSVLETSNGFFLVSYLVRQVRNDFDGGSNNILMTLNIVAGILVHQVRNDFRTLVI